MSLHPNDAFEQLQKESSCTYIVPPDRLPPGVTIVGAAADVGDGEYKVSIFGFGEHHDAYVIGEMKLPVPKYRFTDPRVTAHAKAMSDALIKVRPLGGSELFTRIRLDGDDEVFLADAEVCGAEIDRMHRELIEAKAEIVRLKRLMQIAKPGAEMTDDQFGQYLDVMAGMKRGEQP